VRVAPANRYQRQGAKAQRKPQTTPIAAEYDIADLSYKLFLPYIRAYGRFLANERNVMDSAYVTSKGQLVVPARIRRRFGIKPGTRINFVQEGDRIIFQPVTREYIESFCGIFKQKPGEKSVVQELLEERRAEKEKEDRK